MFHRKSLTISPVILFALLVSEPALAQQSCYQDCFEQSQQCIDDGGMNCLQEQMKCKQQCGSGDMIQDELNRQLESFDDIARQKKQQRQQRLEEQRRQRRERQERMQRERERRERERRQREQERRERERKRKERERKRKERERKRKERERKQRERERQERLERQKEQREANRDPWEKVEGCGGPADRHAGSNCVQVVETKRGDRCGKKSSVTVRYRNTCSKRIYMKYCLEKEDGSWSCGETGVRPGGHPSASWTCKGTGRHNYLAVISQKPSADWSCMQAHPAYDKFNREHK